MTRYLSAASAAILLIACAASPVHAQSDSNASSQAQGSRPDSKPAPEGPDMDEMMQQCAQMREQMKPGAAMTPDMQKMMKACDDMDRAMGEQPYVPPADRRR